MNMHFTTQEGHKVPAISVNQMREVDRIAVDQFRLGLLQMMENAGRNLSKIVQRELEHPKGPVAILAGPGGNGGGGLCCARHLHNRGVDVSLILSKDKDQLGDAAARQLAILMAAGFQPLQEPEVDDALARAEIVVDALIGYSLLGAPRGRVAELITRCNNLGKRVISLDVPSGLDGTTGEAPGVIVQAETILTLALPKIGLAAVSGAVYLADIGIPPAVYKKLGIDFEPFFGREDVLLIKPY
jgi:NAD(P)H-hydrate epimerase